MRLAWRGVGGRRIRLMSALLAALAVAAHVGAWFLVRSWPSGTLPPIATLIFGAAAWLL